MDQYRPDLQAASHEASMPESALRDTWVRCKTEELCDEPAEMQTALEEQSAQEPLAWPME